MLFIPLFEGDRDTLDAVQPPRVLCGIGGEPPFDAPPECVFYERESVSGDLPVWLQIEDSLFLNEKPFFLSDEFEQGLFGDNPIDFGETDNFRDLKLNRKPLMPPLFNGAASIPGGWIDQLTSNQSSVLKPSGSLPTSSFLFQGGDSIVSSEPLEALNRFFDSLKIGVEKPRVQLEDFTGSSSQPQLEAQLDQVFYSEDYSLYVEGMANVGVSESVSKEGAKVFDDKKFADLNMELPQDSDVGSSKFDFESALVPDVGNQANDVDANAVNKQGNGKVDDLETIVPYSESQPFLPSTDLEIDLNDSDVVPLLLGLINKREQGIIRDEEDDPAHIPEKQSWVALSLLAGYFMWRHRKKQ